MIIIRADANEQIGTGHVMRCLSVAKAFALRGIEALFVTADEKGNALIEQNGFHSVCLNSVWTDLEAELPALQFVINKYQPSFLLIDSYFVTQNYFQVLSKLVKTAYIDDMNKERWDVDAIINYNIFASVFNYSWYNTTRTKLIIHPRFAPLREEFKNCPEHTINTYVKDIIVSAGGADPEHITKKILKKICSVTPDIRFHFVVGALNPRLEEIKSLASENFNAVLHINESHMSDLMKKCDIAISAAGTTLYELCACGIPTITYTLADNQLVAAEQFEAQGVMISAGDCRGDDEFIERVETNLTQLAAKVDLRRELSQKMQALVDGNGSERLVEELLLM